MNNVTTLKKQRTVGSLTAEDLGIEIEVADPGGNQFITPVMVTHRVDEHTGDEFTQIYMDTSWLFPEEVLVVPSNSTFTVVEP